MTNIYQKQMNKLKLNAKEYAELTGMPYEVVKDILYNKKGDYSMEIKSLLRKNMMSKHQEIENDYENAKIRATEYLLEQEEKSNTQDIDNSPINEEIEILDTTDTLQDNSASDIIDNSTHQIELDNSEILRKILINRLTDEEKELIKIFGGKIC